MHEWHFEVSDVVPFLGLDVLPSLHVIRAETVLPVEVWVHEVLPFDIEELKVELLPRLLPAVCSAAGNFEMGRSRDAVGAAEPQLEVPQKLHPVFLRGRWEMRARRKG